MTIIFRDEYENVHKIKKRKFIFEWFGVVFYGVSIVQLRAHRNLNGMITNTIPESSTASSSKSAKSIGHSLTGIAIPFLLY